MGNLNNLYKKQIDILKQASQGICKEFNINIEIEVPQTLDVNASVGKLNDETYLIRIYPECFNLQSQIKKITERYDENDYLTFERIFIFNIFEQSEDDTYREKLSNLINSFIVLHIFFHELGHIIAHHVSLSFDSYLEYNSEMIGNYELQEKEMVADWLSTKTMFSGLIQTFVFARNYDLSKLLICIKQMTELYWVSLSIEFQIFESRHGREVVNDYSKLTHPTPALRLYYNIEAVQESVMDILELLGINKEESEKASVSVINECMPIIMSFIDITDVPIVTRKNNINIMDYYLTLREEPYKEGKREDGFHHLQEIDDEYKQAVEQIRNHPKWFDELKM